MEYPHSILSSSLTPSSAGRIFAPDMARRFLLLLILARFLFPAAAAEAQKRPEVGGTITMGPSIELLSVAVEDFRIPAGFSTLGDSLVAHELKKLLVDDLAFSLYFNVVEVDPAFLAEFARGKMDLDDWIYLGAQLLISGRFEAEGQALLLTIDVTDVLRNKNVYSHDFIGSNDRYRYLAHQAAR